MKKSLAILDSSPAMARASVGSGEVAVLSAGAVEPGSAAAAAYEKQTGRVVKIASTRCRKSARASRAANVPTSGRDAGRPRRVRQGGQD